MKKSTYNGQECFDKKLPSGKIAHLKVELTFGESIRMKKMMRSLITVSQEEIEKAKNDEERKMLVQRSIDTDRALDMQPELIEMFVIGFTDTAGASMESDKDSILNLLSFKDGTALDKALQSNPAFREVIDSLGEDNEKKS